MTFPTQVKPMLAKTGPGPFNSEKHLFEIKWNGIRCIALVDPGGRLTLQSRTLKDVTAKFPELSQLPASCRHTGTVFDGELVVLGPDSRPDFSLIQGGLGDHQKCPQGRKGLHRNRLCPRV
ncbi:MAG: hypothetical protein H0Z38_08875 [Firmicutes bacterium]|nr:hypothetical protein [Bacillota bacterium]